MATLTNAFGTPTDVTITDITLAAAAITSTAIVGPLTATDILVGGFVSITSGTIVAGDTVNVYVTGQYSDTATDMGGGINTGLAADTLITDETDFMKANLTLLAVISLEAGAVAQDYHWGPVAVAGAFGGVLPENVMFVYENDSAGATDDITIDYVTVTPTSTA